MKKRLVSSIINGLSGGMLSAGWLSHQGITSFLIPLLCGIGTALFYIICGLPKFHQNKTLITCLILTGGLVMYIPTSHILHTWERIMTLFFLLMLGLYPLFLRTFPYVKSVVISTCWTFFILILPFWLSGAHHRLPLGELSFIWLLFYALTIPSDIRDINCDHPSLRTLPQLTGSFNAGFIAMVLIVIYGIGQYYFSGKFLMLWFSLLALLAVGSYLRQRKAWLIVGADGLLLVLGAMYFCI